MSKIAKNTSFLFISHLVGKVFAFGLLIILPRYLGEGEFGKYFFALSFTNLTWSIVELGMQTPLTREIAMDASKAKNLTSNALSIRLILSVIAFMVMATLIKRLDYPKETVTVVYVIGLSELLNSISYLFRSIFRAFERMEYEGLSVLVERGLTFFVGSILVALGYDLMTFCWAVLAASFISLSFAFIITTWKFARISIMFEREVWVDLLKKSLPFVLGNTFYVLYFRVDALMLSKLSSLGEIAVGWYGIAYSLVMALTILPGAFSGAIFPAMARSFNPSNPSSPSNLRSVEYYPPPNLRHKWGGNMGNMNSEFQTLYSRSLRLMFTFALPLGISIWIASDEIIRLLYSSSKFPPTAIEAISSTLGILVWAGVLLFLNFVLITVLRAADKRVAFTAIIGSTAILNIVINAFLIPKYNQVGAAIAMVISEGFFFISAFGYIWIKICRPYGLRSTLKLILVSLVVGVILSSIKGNVSSILLIAISIGFYGATVCVCTLVIKP